MIPRIFEGVGEAVFHRLLDVLDRITGQARRDREAKARERDKDTWGRD